MTYSIHVEGVDGFFTEPAKPLAIWFNGNNAIDGEEAFREASQPYSINAYKDLFDKIDDDTCFEFYGEQHKYSRLAFMAIRVGLKNFYQKFASDYGLGSLDDNKDGLPLLFSFEVDVPLNVQEKLMVQFMTNGFHNICKVDENYFCLKCAATQDSQMSMIVTSDASSVFASAYKGTNFIKTYEFADANDDPRINKACKCIWERRDPRKGFYGNFEQEYDVIRKAAVEYINSNAGEYEGTVVFSDGKKRSFWLSRDDLKILSGSGNIAADLKYKMLGFGDISGWHLILKERAANNSYLFGLFKEVFPYLSSVTKEVRALIDEKIIKFCDSKGYKFEQSDELSTIIKDNLTRTASGNQFGVTTNDAAGTDNSNPFTIGVAANPDNVSNNGTEDNTFGSDVVKPDDTNKQSDDGWPNGDSLPPGGVLIESDPPHDPKAKKYVKKVNILIEHRNIKNIKALLEQMHRDGVHYFDEKLNKVLKELDSEKKLESKPKVVDRPTVLPYPPPSEYKKWQTKVDIWIGQGKKALLTKGLEQLHKAHVYEFDKQINEALKKAK